MLMKNVLVFGASENVIARARKNIDFTKINILAFVDNDSEKKGKIVKKGLKRGKQYSIEWDLDEKKVIGPEDICNYKYDYIFIGTLVYAEKIGEQLEKTFLVGKDKILLILEHYFNPIFSKIHMFANNRENSSFFIDNKYDGIIKYANVLNEAIDKKQNVLQFKKLKISLDAYYKDENLSSFEFEDICQEYVFGGELLKYGEGPYEYDKVAIEKNDIVLDCGANIGLFSALAAAKAPLGKVYAFEPIQSVCLLLEKTVELYDNIFIKPIALSDYAGEVNMKFEEENKSCGKITDEQEGANLQTVKVNTIDNFVEEHKLRSVDFIKADIEGAERGMLRGATKTLKRFAPKLAICTYHLPDDKEVLEKIIKEANPEYVVKHNWLKLYAYVPKK